MNVVIKQSDGAIEIITEQELDEYDGIYPFIVMGYLHDKKPVCNMCNDELDADSPYKT